MIRIDRKTGEPILSPRLTPDQLHAMADDPGWRPWMHLIAAHPHAWPELMAWWHLAQEQGFDAAGAAPLPPASMRGRGRIAIPSAPLPPEDDPDPQQPAPVMAAKASGEQREDASAPAENQPTDAMPSHAGADELGSEPHADPDASETGPAQPGPAETEALEDAAGDFIGIEEFSDPEPATAGIPPLPESAHTEKPTEETTDSFDDAFADIKVRHAIPWKTIGILAAVILAMGLIAGGAMLRHRGSEESAQRVLTQAAGDCTQAHGTAARRRDRLTQAMEDARELVASTTAGQVADRSTLDELDRLAGETVPALPACSATELDAARIADIGRGYELSAKALADATAKVNDSILDKTVADARKLHDESAGKVADEQTRADLAQAIVRRDADAIGKATAKVNESIKAKEQADREREQAEAAARQQADQQQTTQPAPGITYGGSSNGGTGRRTTGGSPNKSTPAPSTPNTPAPAPAPAAPTAPSKPSGNDGAVVG